MTEERNQEKPKEETGDREREPGKYSSKEEVGKEEETGGALPDSSSGGETKNPK